MYNTVGETAGVTQDVGSDPTVGWAWFFFFEVVWGGEGGEGWWCCMFCGRVRGDEGGDCEMEMGEDEEEEKVRVGMIGLADMSRLEDEDVEMDEDVEESSQVEQRLDDDDDDDDDDAGRPSAQDILT